MHGIQQIRELFDAYASAVSWQKRPFHLYQPVKYVMDLKGKRIRPLFSLMATRMFNEQVNLAVPMAYAVELFHNFTLVHDDMMDEAEIRRGTDSVHKRFGPNRALLSGDVMLVYTYQFLHSYQDSYYFGDLLDVFTHAAIHVCEGQQMDMDFEKRQRVSLTEYLQMIEYKTSVLFAAGLKMGAMIGGADPVDQDRLYEFGRKLGIAFQIQDDWLDLYGASGKVGKKQGGDIDQKKKTILIIKALEVLPKEKGNQLLELLESDEKLSDKLDKIQPLLDEADVRKEVQSMITEYNDQAMQHLHDVDAEAEHKRPMIEMATQLLEREH